MKFFKSFSGKLALTLIAAAATLPLFARPANWQAPELDPFTEPVSKSRWLWFQAKNIGQKTTAYYRAVIELEDEVKSAWMYLLMDDNGVFKANDQSIRYSYPPQSS